eukprot:TRINITY_DN45892_c0_g1_i1.p1 TRINITY_DN45892_c0_g1~~TRINITY_DN45892_c0_g1_i1.p1  ORF type:complete len:126 (-),score=35.39 TRINITY_DN45892_c0_g1_i1:552-929(-)
MCIFVIIVCFFFFKQKTAYEMLRSLVGSEMCIRDSAGVGQPTAAWNACYVCGDPEQLVCCDSCPALFHPECVRRGKLKFSCHNCSAGSCGQRDPEDVMVYCSMPEDGDLVGAVQLQGMYTVTELS